MASVITVAFENWKAQEAASGKAVLLDEFVFAYVPNLDPTKPIDRNEKLPTANQIVHRQAVNKAGLASENAVAYSVTMGADVGNFDFNWIGLLNKASGTVAMITHAPTQKKLKNQNGQQGNVLTRSFILEFQGAAEETQIKTSAETWQIDFTARLSGIDEMQRLINVDSYGAAAFFNDSFEVTRSGEQYTVKKGFGYVGGLRGELAQNQILNGLRNTKVYADFSYQGNIVSQWNTVVKITSAATLNNYIDAAGFTHQVFAIANIDASGNVKDLRSMGALSSQEISALETRLKLDLSKKIDKANITHQMGNSTELVVSQQLLATELGKKQPAGNYAPAGDYATNAALNNGLNSKMDARFMNTGVGNDVIWKGQHAFTQVGIGEAGMSGKRMWITLDGLSINPTGNSFYNVKWPEKGGMLMQVGDLGFGAGRKSNATDTITIKNFNDADRTAVYKSDDLTENARFTYSPMLNMTRRGGADGTGFCSQIQVDSFTGILSSRGGTSGGRFSGWMDAYSPANTIKDHNGNLKVSGSSNELSDYPVGAPIPWSQATAPSGYLVCNGQSFNKTTYPLLAKAYPTGILPDLRGEFLRGLDAGRGVNTGRAVLSAEGDAFRAHNHSVIGEDSGSGTAYFGRGNGSRRSITKDAMNLEGGTETRPRNIAFLYIVRAA
ncbi:phage tail protein [Providencia rettgeri]|uniref:Phage tail protein n=1 Tax=Providencia rettgeri TaxID=587 RepID=A0AB35LCN5_PRORE|nr:phage tail protein [Providencia rettgeri]MDH2306472.1 phage tail protein [Providencia rettgeri]